MTTRPMPNVLLPDDWFMDENHEGWDDYGVEQITDVMFVFYRDSEEEWLWIEDQGMPGDLKITEIKGNDGQGFMKTSFGPYPPRKFYNKREFTFHNKGDAALFKLTFF